MSTNDKSPYSNNSSFNVVGGLWNLVKLLAAAGLCVSAFHHWSGASSDGIASESEPGSATALLPWRQLLLLQGDTSTSSSNTDVHRRLQQQQQFGVSNTPSYMKKLTEDLIAREKLFDDTPPEEIKYWFEYFGPLQVRSIVTFCCKMIDIHHGFCARVLFLV